MERSDGMMEQGNAFVDENKEDSTAVTSRLLDIHAAPELLTNLQKDIQNALTKWIEYKTALIHVATEGIREYLRGSSVGNHYDKQGRVISAIIHLESDKPWVLNIEDHTFRTHSITMEYGDVVFYESTIHGRPTPYDGESYKVMYIHFKPERW